MPAPQNMVVNNLGLEELPPVSRMMRLDRGISWGGVVLFPPGTFEPPPPPPPGEGPILDAVPTSADSFWTGEGNEYFVPLARLATRSPSSTVPAVFLDPIAGVEAQTGGAVLR